MDEQRLQAYASLVEQLLRCPQGQESAMLQANAELLNVELLAVMEQYAAYLESQSDGNAKWLREFAAQLAKALGLETASAADLEDAAQFLWETLQLVAEHQDNLQQIYPVWAQQQTRFNGEFLKVLPIVAEQLLAGDTEQRTVVAAVLVEFGDLINQFPLGTRWLNLELGITAYEQALMVRTKQACQVSEI